MAQSIWSYARTNISANHFYLYRFYFTNFLQFSSTPPYIWIHRLVRIGKVQSMSHEFTVRLNILMWVPQPFLQCTIDKQALTYKMFWCILFRKSLTKSALQQQPLSCGLKYGVRASYAIITNICSKFKSCPYSPEVRIPQIFE